jgi:RHS repeat-associated protein
MKKLFIKSLLVGFPILHSYEAICQAPTANKPITNASVPAANATVESVPLAYPSGTEINYVRIKEARGSLANPDYKETTQYLDGLGRPIQTVNKAATPNGKDFVQPKLYDQFGREVLKYLPYPAQVSDGEFKLNPFNDQKTFMQAQFQGEQVYYGKTIYDNSPLSRVVKTFAPGNSWAGSEGSVGSQNEKSTQYQYLINTEADAVRIWTITNDLLEYDIDGNILASKNVPTSTSAYLPETLFKSVSLDENGTAIVEYKDKSGTLLLKKVQVGSIATDYSGYDGFLCTYYVYDDFDRLRFVIPPKAVEAITNWALTDDVVSELCYRYEYDARNRMIAKKIPGAAWSYMIYDRRDRLLFTQDGNMRKNNQWFHIMYDKLNRQRMTGIVVNTSGVEQFRTHVETASFLSSEFGMGMSFMASDLYYSQYDPSAASPYVAMNSINFLPGFDSGTGGLMAFISSDPVWVWSGGSVIMYIDFVERLASLPNTISSGPLTITYYDQYATGPFVSSYGYSTTDNSKLDNGTNTHAENLPTQRSLRTRGMITDQRTFVEGTYIYKRSTMSYDDKGRNVQVASSHFNDFSQVDITTNKYDFNGKLICSYQNHTNHPAGQSADIRVKTNFNYDNDGRLLEIWKTINDDDLKKVLVAKNQYNELGQLISKELGRKRDDNGNYTTTPLETLDYSYNIRGWLQGINKDYSDGNGSLTNGPWFGMELKYDWGFGINQYNGNIAGIKWRSRGDDERRAYGFTYDKLGRILGADFSQASGSNYLDNAAIKFDMAMGNGTDGNAAYDANGNIKSMRQWGLKLGSTNSLIDDLAYTYSHNGSPHTNKLLNVIDAQNDAQTKLADFRSSQSYMTLLNNSKTSSAIDYTYDANGNLMKDLNKDIGTSSQDGIEYNRLNLPTKIVVRDGANIKGTITYIYDALGNKFKKIVAQSAFANEPANGTETMYIDNFVYENGDRQFMSHEEGRIRPVVKSNGETVYYSDYFIKDHLGNVRMVLTDEHQTDIYHATMESASRNFETALFGDKIVQTVSAKPTGFDEDAENDNVSAVSASSAESRIGPGVILKVMAGDRIKARTYAWYQPNGDKSVDNALPAIVGNIVSQLVPSISGLGKGSNAQNITNQILQPGVESFLENQTHDANKPKAYLNWILFDEELFQKVNSSSGFTQVPSISGAEAKKILDAVPSDGLIEIKKNGFIYVYVSNESRQNVYFDDIHIEHIRGPLLEETHYYPFGLTMSGISSKAFKEGGYSPNRKEFNGIEHTTDLDLNQYDAFYRTLDPQIGRFLQIDPKIESADSWSSYCAMLNSPVLRSDPLGDSSIKPGNERSIGNGVRQGAINFGTGSVVSPGAAVAIGVAQVADGDPEPLIKTLLPGLGWIDKGIKFVSGDKQDKAEVGTEIILTSFAMVFGAKVASGPKTTTLYRAVSNAELADIKTNGFRVNPDLTGYQEGKLFATTAADAAQYGKNNYALDHGTPNTIVQGRVSQQVMAKATAFEADGMKAISIPANQLKTVNFAGSLNYSPKPTNPFGSPGW